MIKEGQVYKFSGMYGIIRGNEWGQNRIDVLFPKAQHNMLIGDRVEYEEVIKKGRKFAENLKKV